MIPTEIVTGIWGSSQSGITEKNPPGGAEGRRGSSDRSDSQSFVVSKLQMPDAILNTLEALIVEI